MDTTFDRGFKRTNWLALIMFSLGFWLSGSIIVDSVIIPGLALTGMMNQSGFASTGYLIFGIFNRIELICAALTLTGCLAFSQTDNLDKKQQVKTILFAVLLVIIPLIYTYVLTPQMSAWGMQLNVLESSSTMPAIMISMHEIYWFLEVVKLVVATLLLRYYYGQFRTSI